MRKDANDLVIQNTLDVSFVAPEIIPWPSTAMKKFKSIRTSRRPSSSAMARLSTSKLCKAESTGEVLPLPVDSLVNRPQFVVLSFEVREIWFGLMCGLNHLCRSDPCPKSKVSRIQFRACSFLVEEAEDMVERLHEGEGDRLQRG